MTQDRLSQPFEALYYEELLHCVNPVGDTGLLTLWSPLRSVKRRLDSIAPDVLDGSRSRIAVMSNLYGDGMYAMFCNLLFNPQIRHLIAIGEDLGLQTCMEIEAFLAEGLEDTVMLGMAMKRIAGTGRVFPAIPEFDEQGLRSRLSFRYLGKLSGVTLAGDLGACLDELPRAEQDGALERLRVEMSPPSSGEGAHQPSQIDSHQVTRRTPLDCWEELVVRTVRFGRPVTLRTGPRLELLNAKAVIARPARDAAAALEDFGFRLQDFLDYQEDMLQALLPEEVSYTYGNRLRGYFQRQATPLDTLQVAIETLRANPESRHAFISLWDTPTDLPDVESLGDHAPPCLVTLFFRHVDGALSLTATYRSHNLLTAWMKNVYGLMAVQSHVAKGAEMEVGPITVVSHSLGIDPRNPRYELARTIADRWKHDDDLDRGTGKYALRSDPNGYFVMSVDHERQSLVAEHRYEGVLIKRYEGAHAGRLAKEISADMAVSLVSHALWLGRELARMEQQLRSGGDSGDPQTELIG